ncbi:MAG TPA: RNA polymerase sigma factor [Acidimicrobiales bacterium]|nr:RNA polymerase sigma factor [Acidimicrobiales bacterium]
MSLPPFAAVVDEHAATVLRVCRAVVGPTDAEDAAADALLAALEAYPRLRPDSDLRAWLVTIAHRKAVDLARRRGRSAPVASVAAAAHPGPEPADGALWSAVAALPVKQRSAVTLRYVGDLAYAEVAAEMGVSEAAARRSAADGLAALRLHHRRHTTEEPTR